MLKEQKARRHWAFLKGLDDAHRKKPVTSIGESLRQSKPQQLQRLRLQHFAQNSIMEDVHGAVTNMKLWAVPMGRGINTMWTECQAVETRRRGPSYCKVHLKWADA